MAEEWREIPGFAGRYQASDQGRVATMFFGDRKIMAGKPVGAYGHAQIGLRRGKVRIFRYIHQWVLLAFVGPCPEGMESLHRDGDATNCAATNLHYGTRRENADDRVAHGRSCRGQSNGRAKLTIEQVHVIRERCAAGDTQEAIAGDFGIGQGIVSKIKRRELWKHAA